MLNIIEPKYNTIYNIYKQLFFKVRFESNGYLVTQIKDSMKLK